MKIHRFALQRVDYMPAKLEPGMLYVSEKYSTAAHLCACGCGAKIRTPLGPTEWSFTETKSGPSLSPSIGNWQQACQSHYWIDGGEINWAPAWSPEQIKAGRRQEQYRRQMYYDARKPPSLVQRIWRWMRSAVLRILQKNQVKK